MEAVVSLEAATVGAIGTGEAVILEGAARRRQFLSWERVFSSRKRFCLLNSLLLVHSVFFFLF